MAGNDLHIVLVNALASEEFLLTFHRGRQSWSWVVKGSVRPTTASIFQREIAKPFSVPSVVLASYGFNDKKKLQPNGLLKLK